MRSASSSTCSRRTTCSPNGSPASCTISPSMPSPGKAGVTEQRQAGDDRLAAEALNTLGGLHLSTGAPDEARRVFLEALELGGSNREVRARVEQNLGILANIRGELHEAIARYERSLDAYRDCGDDHGCALPYHNPGLVSAGRQWRNAADCYFRESRTLAERVGDVYLRGLWLVNHAELDVTRQRFEDARQKAEEALAVFDQL